MKSRTLGILILAISLMTFNACKKDEAEPGQIRLQFSATVGAEDYAPFTPFTYYNGASMTINKVVFYISNVELTKSNGSTELLSDISYVELSDPTNPGLAEFVFDDIPAGDYTGIRFGIGVPADLNAKTPADFAASHPLAIESMYWDAWDSYIFSKTEGRIDTTGDGEGDLNYLYHTGIDDLYRGLQAQKTFSLGEGAEKEMQFQLDVLKLFGNAQDHIDIKAKPTSHNPADLEVATKIMDNYVNALSFNF